LSDYEAGLSSANFDLLAHNIGTSGNSDTRAGLDGNAKQAIMRIMDERQISFDDARLIYTRAKMAESDISKYSAFVFFSLAIPWVH